MSGLKHPFPRLPIVLTLATAMMASGCHYVKRDEFQSEMERVRADMRGEIQAGDASLAERVDGVEARLSALETGLQDLQEEFGATVERMEASLRVFVPVHFGFDQAEVEPDATPVLDRLGKVLHQYYPEALVTVEGFTDPAGSRAYNQRLGQARADNVRGYLVAKAGLAGGQVRAVSYGEDVSRLVRPGAQGPGEAGRENRRVVIVIDHPHAWTSMAAAANGTS